MTGKDIDEKVLKKYSGLKAGIVCAIICVVLWLVVGVACLMNIDLLQNGSSMDINNSILMPVFAGCCPCGMVAFILAVIFLIMGGSARSRINKFVNEHGEEQVMSAINKARHVYARRNRPITIFTDDFIYEVGVGFVGTNYDLAYGYSYKGNTSLHVYTITNKSESICRGIPLRSNDMKQVMATLASYNPSILLGYTGDNMNEHRARVKQHRING